MSAGTQKGELKSESPVPFSYFRGKPLRIGNQIQLLVDDYLIEDRWKLQRQVGRVNKFMRNPVIVQDKPWEDPVGGYPSVLYDDESGKCLMWYQCFNLSNYFSKEGPSYYVGHAESEDGFNWTVSWNRQSDLSQLKGKAIYLRLQPKNADLYTIQIQP